MVFLEHAWKHPLQMDILGTVIFGSSQVRPNGLNQKEPNTTASRVQEQLGALVLHCLGPRSQLQLRLSLSLQLVWKLADLKELCRDSIINHTQKSPSLQTMDKTETLESIPQLASRRH